MAADFLGYEFYKREAGERFLDLTEQGMSAAFIYTASMAVGGEVVSLSPDNKLRSIAKSGVALVPISFIERAFGAAFEAKDGGYSVSLCDKELFFKPDSSAAEICGKPFSFSVAPEVLDGAVYLPLCEAASALGLSAKAYYENRLIAVGSAEHIDALDRDEDAVTAGAYILHGRYEPKNFGEADYAAARANWRKKLVGSPELNDLTEPVIAEKIRLIEKKAKKRWETYNVNPDRTVLWGNHIPTESGELWDQYQGLAEMAKGWGTYGCELYHNEELRLAIVDGMRWMYENMYGEAEIEERGWRSARLFNWWYWYIAAPEFITDVFIIMEDSFDLETKRKYLRCFDWVSTFMRSSLTREHALSRISVCTKVAICLCDPKRLYEEYVDFDMLLGLTEYDEGPRIDYTQWTHGFPMNIGYGALNLDRVLFVASILSGTALEFKNPKQYNQFELIKYMFEPALYRGQGFMMLHGRATWISELQGGANVTSYMLAMLGMFGDDEDKHIKKLMKRNTVFQESVGVIKNNCSIYDCTLIDSILKDDSVSSENDYEYAHAWYTGDRAAQQRNNYAFGIAMTSKREFAYESINGENKTGWHTGDGATYLYTDYDCRQHDGNNFITKNINIAYRFPGTTEDSREREILSIRSDQAWRSSRSFAGSIQLENKYIAAGMDFEAYHFEGPHKGIVDTGYGGGLPVHLNDLVAKKAWFCFDDEMVCLGAGINSTMNSPVHTTVEHRRIVSDAKYTQYVGGDAFSRPLAKSPYEIKSSDIKWVLMEGNAGYVILDSAKVYVNRYNCGEAGGQPYFEVGIDHGENPKGATYAYAIIPYADKARVASYSLNPDVEILSNTPELQAVREKNLGISSFVFHEAGAAENISSSSPSIIMLADRGGELELALTDPTHEAKEITVVISEQLEVKEANPKMKISAAGGKTEIRIDAELANGRPFRAIFERK